MSLLVDMSVAALDPAYADAAARRAAPSTAGPARRRVPLAATAVLVVVGVVTGIAGAQVRRGADAAGAVREGLLADVRAQTRETDDLADQAARLRTEVVTIRDSALGRDDRGRAAAAVVSRLELVTGSVAVRGPGLVVTLDDAPEAEQDDAATRGGQTGDGRIFDRDLQDVVNALWAVGAEAVTVNGQRLTARTAIRSAGEAVLVDFRPLSPPYTLRAIGDPDRMEPAFVDGPTARRFQTWTSLYGLGFAVARADDLRLAAASLPELRVADPERAAGPDGTG